jgi:hypothetical protein
LEEKEITMSKKNLAALFAAAVMTLSATSAFASFALDNELVRVVYSTGAGATTTVVNDLGSISSILATSGKVDVAGTGFAYSTLGASANASNTYEAFFAKNNNATGTGTFDMWVAASSAPTTNNRKFATFNSSVIGFNSIYAVTGLANTTGTLSDYQSKFGVAGTLNNTFPTVQEYSLATVAALNLYKFSATNASTFPVTVGTNANVDFTILTNADGSVSFQGAAAPANTPIPPAFLLMGSGLLGMVGLRRKSNKA